MNYKKLLKDATWTRGKHKEVTKKGKNTLETFIKAVAAQR
jgi:hypothetical protein